MNTGCLLLLLYPSVADIRFRKFDVFPVIVITAIFTLIRLYRGQGGVMDILFGCLPGMLFWVLCLMTREAVGRGDAAVVTGLGMMAGGKEAAVICLVGLMLCGLTGLILIVCKKAERKTELPFIPFLLTAFLVLRLYGSWS